MKSLRVRITLAAVLVSVALLSIVAWALYRSVDTAVRDDFDADLLADGKLLAGLVEYDAADGVEVEIEPVIESFGSRPDARTWCALLDEHGGVMAGHDVSVFGDGPEAATSFAWVEVEGARARMVRLRFVPRIDFDPEETPVGWVPNPPELEIVVIRQTERVDALLAGLRQAFWLLGLFAAGGVAIAIAWQVGRGVRPILRAGERLGALRVDNLRHRLDPEAVPTEVRPFIDQLNSLLDRLERGVEREREFSGHVAHELRTPLTVVRVGVELAERRHRDDPTLTARLRKVMATVEEMAQLIDNLLLLSRLERGVISEQREHIDLHALVDTVWDGAAAVAQRRRVAFVNDVPPGHEVHSCPTSLQTIVRNLLSNAAAYTEADGQVRVRVLPGGAFEVWDSGPQLPEAQLQRVFDRFWRADEARTHATAHAGIGLSLVRELADALRLSVSVENVATGGLRFLVRPSTPAAASSRVEPAFADRSGRWKRVVPAAAAIVVALIAMGAAAAYAVRASSDRVHETERPASEALLDARHGGAPVWTPVEAAVEPAAEPIEDEPADAIADEEGELEEPSSGVAPVGGDRSAAPTRGTKDRVAPGDASPGPDANALPSQSASGDPVPVGPSAIPSPSAPPWAKEPVGSTPPSQRGPTDGSAGASPRSGSASGLGGGGGGGVGGSGGGGASPSTRSAAENQECEDGEPAEGTRIDAGVCLAYGDLSPMVTNPWFPLPIGRLTVFQGKDEDEVVRIESTVLGELELIGSVDALVVERFEFEDGELIEWSLEYFAQAPDGTVCFLGEDAEIYEDEELVEREGWRVGVDGAVPGIAMPGDPSAGTWHTIGGEPEAEDNANIIGLDDPFTSPAGSWSETVSTQEWNPTEPCAVSGKIYARGVGMVFDGELPLVSFSDGHL